MHFGQEYCRNHIVSFSMHHMGFMTLICLITGDVNLDRLLKVVPPRFLHCKVTIFPNVFNKYLWDLLWNSANPLFLQTFHHFTVCNSYYRTACQCEFIFPSILLIGLWIKVLFLLPYVFISLFICIGTDLWIFIFCGFFLFFFLVGWLKLF